MQILIRPNRYRLSRWEGRHFAISLLIIFFGLSLVGCGSGNITPSPNVTVNPTGIFTGDENTLLPETAQREPTVVFPALVAMARIQTGRAQGCASQESFCLVSTREFVSEDIIEQLQQLEQLAGIVPISHLLVPAEMSSSEQLRQAASQLQADMVFVYSIGSKSQTLSDEVGPLGLLTLGYVPNKKAYVNSTAAAALYDARTGFLYGVFEGSAEEQRRATSWSIKDATQIAVRDAENEAFLKLIESVEKTWPELLSQYSP